MDLRCRVAAAVIAAALVFSIVSLGLLAGLPLNVLTASGSHDLSRADGGSVEPDNSQQSSTDMSMASDTQQVSGLPSDVTYKTIQDRQDAMGVHPVLMENPDAVDPTYSQVLSFMSTDDTVKNKYVVPTFTCADFAVELQNHAEEQDLKCGYASLKFVGKSDGHAVDVFDTVDRGLIYVDTTGGKPILCDGLYPGESYYNLGVISQVTNYW